MEAEIEELKQTLAQVHSDSQEIEKELEAQLDARDEQCLQLKTQLDASQKNERDWKTKFEELAQEMRSIEVKNDEYEKTLRMNEASMSKLEAENQQLLEQLALIEGDNAHRQILEEELERTKQKLVEAEEEIIELTRSKQKSHQSKAPAKAEEHKRRPSELDKYLDRGGAELRSKDWLTAANNGIINRGIFNSLAPAPIGKGHGTTAITR